MPATCVGTICVILATIQFSFKLIIYIFIIHGSHRDWKNGKAFSSRGIFLKILEKSEKMLLKFFLKYWKIRGNLSVSNSENPANMVPYFTLKKKEL